MAVAVGSLVQQQQQQAASCSGCIDSSGSSSSGDAAVGDLLQVSRCMFTQLFVSSDYVHAARSKQQDNSSEASRVTNRSV
jgi:hypothetical protein